MPRTTDERESVCHYLDDHRTEAVRTLCDYLKIPSISSDPDQKASMVECAAYTAKLLEQAGMHDVQIHPTPGHPIVTGSWTDAVDRPTVLIYGHYDVQPIDPLPLWHHPPFSPHIQHDRLFARGAVDDKGQIFMHIQAIKAILSVHGSLPINVHFLIEGEEEFGSAHLPPFLQSHAEPLNADLALISDSYMWAEGVPAITTSLRGLLAMEMTLTGPRHDLHSGTYGGAVANPLEMLCRLLATVKDEQGRITIPGFHDEVTPIPPSLRQRYQTLPFDEAAFLNRVGVTESWGESGYSTVEKLWLRPTFEINGLWGGFAGPGSKTVLPSQAHAKFSLRLVGNQDPDLMEQRVRDYFFSVLPPGVTLSLTRMPGGGRSMTVPDDFPPLTAAIQALEETFHHPPLLVGEGITIPVVADLDRHLGLATLLIGFALPDAALHSPNENLHLPTFHTGTKSLVHLFYSL